MRPAQALLVEIDVEAELQLLAVPIIGLEELVVVVALLVPIGKRLYFTTSLLANWDKKGDDNDQFLKAYDWDGKELKLRFGIDFNEQGLGRPHIMRFGAKSLYAS